MFISNVNSRPMGHPALWATSSTTSNLEHLTTTMSSLEHDQCNTKESCIQKALNAYHSKQYSNLLKATYAFAIPYSIMKIHVCRIISQIKTQKLAQNLSNAKKKH